MVCEWRGRLMRVLVWVGAAVWCLAGMAGYALAAGALVKLILFLFGGECEL